MDGTQTFAQLTVANPAGAVRAACNMLLGDVGGCVAVLGVVVLAITSGDTAMRSCRLMLADVVRVRQVSVASRLALAFPLFVLSSLSPSWISASSGVISVGEIRLWPASRCGPSRPACVAVAVPASLRLSRRYS